MTLAGSASRLQRLDSTGAIAQPGERYNGIVEVGGSIPPGSTIIPGAGRSGAVMTRPHRLAWPRTPPFQGGDTGSNPVGDATALNKINHLWEFGPTVPTFVPTRWSDNCGW